jgi:hypothetical protein
VPGPPPSCLHLPEHGPGEESRLAGVPEAHTHELGEEDPQPLVEGGDIGYCLVHSMLLGEGIMAVQTRGARTAFVGDGINDDPFFYGPELQSRWGS